MHTVFVNSSATRFHWNSHFCLDQNASFSICSVSPFLPLTYCFVVYEAVLTRHLLTSKSMAFHCFEMHRFVLHLPGSRTVQLNHAVTGGVDFTQGEQGLSSQTAPLEHYRLLVEALAAGKKEATSVAHIFINILSNFPCSFYLRESTKCPNSSSYPGHLSHQCTSPIFTSSAVLFRNTQSTLPSFSYALLPLQVFWKWV